ncbi:MAG: hypothetical protein KAQ75_12595, partial [Bacteroidales bacterium]|nr:hypothetical protein [Bacteroidales bacterium]
MKKIAFTFLFVLFSLISSFSQITEEFTLPYPVEVFDLDQSGPKYFCMNRDFYDYIDTLYFYNPNYSLHKKFEIIGKNKMIYNYSDIKNISENIFNTDDNIEILYFRGDSLKVINENQEILFREYVYASQHFSFYTIKENKHKFKYRYTEDGRYKFAVYNAMNIELEHVYDSANNVVLVNFKFSGEKYVAYNKYCNKVGIFNLDHTLFKEIDLSFTSYSLMDIYEIDNNGTYSYNLSFSSSSNGVYTSYIYNENGDLLAEFNDSQSAVCYNLKTGERKILTSGTPTNSYTAVYNENFEFEKKYDYHSIYKYTDIEFHGEKLCFSDVANNTYYIYNIDNTIFKKIDLNVIYDYGTPDDDLITTHFFNSDDKIEIVYYDNGKIVVQVYEFTEKHGFKKYRDYTLYQSPLDKN